MTAVFVPMWILGAGFVGVILMSTLLSAGHIIVGGCVARDEPVGGTSFPTISRTDALSVPGSGSLGF